MNSQLSVIFQIEYSTQYGQALYLTGNTPELGQWDIKKARKLQWININQWKTNINFSQENIEYKYFVADYDDCTKNILWELGPNRQLNTQQIQQLQDVWNNRKISFIYKGLNNIDKYVFIQGSSAQLGSFVKRIDMQKKEDYFKFNTMVDLEQDKEIFYQFIICQAKKEKVSSLMRIHLNENYKGSCKKGIIQQVYDKSDETVVVYEHSKEICYGKIPKSQKDFNILKQLEIYAVVEFQQNLNSTKLLNARRVQDLVYIEVNISELKKKKNLFEQLQSLIQLFIKKYKSLYLCNNSIKYLKKYLDAYQETSTIKTKRRKSSNKLI